jgi:N4-gp56 family major capsid protein
MNMFGLDRRIDEFGGYHSPNIAYVTNASGQFTADIENFIQDEVLPLAQRQLVGFQLGDPLTLPKGRGVTYTGTRFNRIQLPSAPLSEGVPPQGQPLSISQVTATAQQWGDLIRLTDVAELTIKHPVMKQANFVLGLQIGETLDRNTWNSLLAGTQVNFPNSKGSRAALVAADVLDPHTINRTVAALSNIGAPMFDGQTLTDEKIDAHSEALRKLANYASPHYVLVGNDFVLADFAENNTVVLAWSYSDINKLYNYEYGSWRGTRMCHSNMLPSWVGVSALNGSAGAGGTGTLAAGTYFIQATASDGQNQYESRVYAVSSAIAAVPATGSVNVTLPALSGYTFNVYIGTTASPANLGLTTSGPTVGPMAGQATQLAPNQTVVITGIGQAQVPPAAPASGVTVYPTFIIGRGAYGQVSLDEVKISWLDKADKSDPLNQVRVVGWKIMYGTLIENNLFFARIESSSAFSAAFG